jgi:hypothetical protein
LANKTANIEAGITAIRLKIATGIETTASNPKNAPTGAPDSKLM